MLSFSSSVLHPPGKVVDQRKVLQAYLTAEDPQPKRTGKGDVHRSIILFLKKSTKVSQVIKQFFS